MNDWYPRTISLLVPTRGRPEMIRAMWDSARLRARHANEVELIVGLDVDDPTRMQWLGMPGTVLAITKERRLLSQYWNECAAKARGGILWHGNDDVLFHTENWDDMIREAFDEWPDRIGCVHGNDGIWGAGQATLGFYSREWMQALGYFVPPYFSSDYNDTWLSTVADMVRRRRFLPDLYTEHLHPAVNKGVMDQTHQDRLIRHRQDGVDQLYASLAPERETDARKLLAAIDKAAA